MTDERGALEHLADRVTPRPDAFERLAREMDRRRRGRRLAGALVGLAVAGAGALGAILVLEDVAGRQPAPTDLAEPSTPPASISPDPSVTPPVEWAPFPALWPERRKERALAAQAVVDAGGGSHAWRLDPYATAERFAGEVLGYLEPTAEPCFVGMTCTATPPDHETAYVYQTPPCKPPGPCTLQLQLPLVVHLQRLVIPGDNGIWSVTKVDGVATPEEPPHPHIELEPGAKVEAGGILEVSTVTGEGTLPLSHPGYVAGFGYVGVCTEVVTPVELMQVDDGVATMRVADIGFHEDCVEGQNMAPAEATPPQLDREIDGYVFVAFLEFPTEFAPFDPPPDRHTCCLTAVPVRFAPANSEPEDEWTMYTSDAGWAVDHPESFVARRFARQFRSLSAAGVWLANFEAEAFLPPWVAGVSRPPFPSNGALLIVMEQFGGGGIPSAPGRDSSFPLSLDDFGLPGRGAVGWPFMRSSSFVANGQTYILFFWRGSETSIADREAVGRMVASLRFLSLDEGTYIGGYRGYFVLGRTGDYEVGSVTRFDPADLCARSCPFYLVRVGDGFYALDWPSYPEQYSDCDVRFDPRSRQFVCPENGARWHMDGSVAVNPDPQRYRDERLRVQQVRLSLDGHVLVSPYWRASIGIDLRLT